MYNNLFHEENVIYIERRRGPRGHTGPTGPSGGPPGPKGDKGDKGEKGDKGNNGEKGDKGNNGEKGDKGNNGEKGDTGNNGEKGDNGNNGEKGEKGDKGDKGNNGEKGDKGNNGEKGDKGDKGNNGLSVSFSSADFFALMPGDNGASIAAGADLSFPQNGPTFGTDVIRLGPSSFTLVSVGIYQVMFQVSITESGQLCIVLNAGQNPTTVVGRATGTSQLVGICLVQTVLPGSILSIRNPLGEPIALTATPVAGGTNPVSAHLVITRLA